MGIAALCPPYDGRYADDDESEAAAVMEQNKVRRVFVLNRREQVVGIVSLGDISSVDVHVSGETLQTITKQ